MKIKSIKIFGIFFIVLTGFISSETNAMIRNNVFSSPIKGVVLDSGSPVAGAVIKRKIIADGLSESGHHDSVASDSEGRFRLPVIEKRSFFKPGFLGSVPTVLIELTVEVKDHTYAIFFSSKKNFTLGGEGLGDVINMQCDISKYKMFDGYRTVQCEFDKE